jgi:hypothetical protein
LRVEADLRRALERFSQYITRIEVHLSDISAGRSGGNDKRCLLEARIAGREPMSVSHQAPDPDGALDGATGKLVRALDTVFGKLDSGRRSSGRLGSNWAE